MATHAALFAGAVTGNGVIGLAPRRWAVPVRRARRLVIGSHRTVVNHNPMFNYNRRNILVAASLVGVHPMTAILPRTSKRQESVSIRQECLVPANRELPRLRTRRVGEFGAVANPPVLSSVRCGKSTSSCESTCDISALSYSRILSR